MNYSRARVAGALALVAAILTPAAHAQQTPQRAQGTLKEGVRAVLVDVVVRDKKGQPVRDLTQADFQIVEDGVPQTIGSFAPVFDARAASAATTASNPPPATVSAGAPIVGSGPGVTALVFDRLGPESRRLAALSARNYLGAKEESSDFVAVFGIDLALTPYVPFTRNAVALRKALDAVATSVNTGFNTPDQRRAITEATQAAVSAAQSASNATASAGGPAGGANVGTAAGAALLTQLQVNMVRDFEDMDLDQKGYATVNALFAIIRSMARIPGRKNIVLFSEGISTTAAVHRLYLGVIDAANRANVSIYTLDAVGLRAESEQARIRDAVNAAGKVGIETGYSDAGGGGSAYTGGLERNEGTLRSDPANSLGELAKGTGGLAFNNTNNLRPAFERIESDIRNYYLLGYTPANDNFDGKFRNIDVVVKRPDVTVSARRGYFALRDPGNMAVNAWEAAALAAIEQKPVPNAFPVRAGSMLFPERGRPGLVPVVVELKTAPLTFEPAADKKSYTSDVTVLVRFVDDQKQVIRKVSQHYEVTGPIEQMEGAKRGEILFYRDSELPSGLYSMETIVYDALSGKSSVRFSTIEVPKYPEGTLRVSSLVQIKRAEKIPERERPVHNPFLVNDVLLYPNLGDPVSKAAKEVGFYFVVYPATGGSAPSASLELMQDGKLAAHVPMPLATPDGNGRIQQLGRLPLDQIAPGIYELRAVVKQGSQTELRSTMLRVVD
ncbi:MAG TPA: VWA domain-containing protein [Vicinamibacterales bacterium]|nr:VWA domain-containing protein [Vicinamibacterales bacterium]